MERIRSTWRFFFGDSARAFGTMSLILLAMLAVAPAKDFFSEWHGYQRLYLRVIRGRGDAVTLRRHFSQGLQQIWIPQMSVTDRCATCHVALKEASMAGAQQPFRPHPPIPHKIDEFGCTICHRGQGGATTVAEAHRSTLAWEQPLLPPRYLESGCGTCHLQPLTGTPRLDEGRALLSREGCVHCHTLRFGDGTTAIPADDPPSLEHIAGKTTPEWIYAWLKDPKAYSTTATMPTFGLSDDDARDVTAFLIAQSTPLAGLHLTVSAKPSSDPAAGTTLYGELFCASCHATQNAAGNMVGGTLGPELTLVGNKVKPDWLVAWLKNPSVYDPNSKMPHYRFTDVQLATLAAFLESKSDSNFLGNDHLPPATPQQATHGKQIVLEYGCASCHEINGVRKPENFAPDLTRVGSRSLAQLIFAPGVQHTLPAYISAKIRDPRRFGPGLKMPKFNLSGEQIDALTTALLSQNERQLDEPAALRVASAPQSHYAPAGQAGALMRDLRCLSCHKVNGQGGDMAPDLSIEGSAVQRAWLVAFLKNPNTLRPTLIRRMPKLNLTDPEANTLADYIVAAYQSPEFQRDELPTSFSPAEIEKGRQLFYSKYACQSCHIIDPTQDKGYIGPTLTGVGARLTPAWIYHYLKDPQALRPGTTEPNQNIGDGDAHALTAFLSSLKQKGAKQ